MTQVATEESPPPPPPPKKIRHRKPDSDPVDLQGALPLFQRRSVSIELWEGFLITITALWMTKPRWEKAREKEPGSGWHPWEFGFIVVAVRVDW